ncbi:hypothetical protein MT325_m383L [Paramecium bursaria chlorella virus MT325]|uniref:Uncharacterized protein m383L n=1 Tax=Paramecium bursaria Chlorella virus MT325 TaxID=346932 RepID=A7IUB3_PBCVM|nr:hypothetical protein MT325_m383L [Paramecium bursaria chlorella virus MT325]
MTPASTFGISGIDDPAGKFTNVVSGFKTNSRSTSVFMLRFSIGMCCCFVAGLQQLKNFSGTMISCD